MMRDIRQEARGKWPAILQELGVPEQFLRNRHGPCPVCGGKDRYRFDDKSEGRFYCTHCGAGDGFDLIQRVRGITFVDALKLIEPIVGHYPVRIAKPCGPSPEKSRKLMSEIWRSGKPIDEVDPVRAWWFNRVGQCPDLMDVRAVHKLNSFQGGHYPAMVAVVRDLGGKAVNLHRTWVTFEGLKAPILLPRKVMSGTIPPGSCVRLMPHGDALGIAEGIETAVAASIIFGMPVWAATNAHNLKNWAPPGGVMSVFIFGDNDANGVGQEAAEVLSQQLTTYGVSNEVHIPSKVGQDWNDVLIGEDGTPTMA